MKSRTLLSTIVCLAAMLASALAWSQNYPDKPIKVIVPAAPGGPTDVLARAIANRLKQTWGATLVVENRPGGALMIGANAVAKSPPDGYTWLLANDGPITINPHLYDNMSYDPLKDLVPITMVIEAPQIMVVHPSVPAKTVAEFIALAKAKPGAMSFAAGGNTSRFASELFRLAAGIDMVHVPYNGSAKAVAALMSGEGHMLFDGLSSSLPYAQAGQLRALAVNSPKRIKELPDLPTIAETIPGFVGYTWIGMFAPAGTPPDIVNTIQREIAKVAAEPAFREWSVAGGMYPVGNSPAEFAAFLKSDTEKWGRVIRDAKIPKPDQ